MNINNMNNIPYGNDQVDTVGYNPQITKDYLQQEHNSLGAPVDDSQPTIKPLVYADELEAGTILQSHVFEHSNSGIEQVAHYSHNTSDEWERQARQADLDATRGRTIYNSSVVGTRSVAPNIAESPKPTQEGLQKAHKEALVNSLTQKINRYQSELGILEFKVLNAEIGLKRCKDELQQLESE